MKADVVLIAPLVQAELARILASSQFVSSDRLQRFLRYIVTMTLEGNTGCLKESVIGVQVFDLEIGFDPKVDPVVRVTARRLRDKLEQFYIDNPSDSGVVIRLPKGGYVPEIIPAPPMEVAEAAATIVLPEADSPAQSQRNFGWWIGAGMILVATAGTLLVIRSNKPVSFAGPVSRFTINLVADQRIVPWYGNNLAFSADGRTLAYVARQDGKRRLFLRPIANSDGLVVNDSDYANAPFFAPDGKSVVYYSPTELRRVYLDGRSSVIAHLPPHLTLFGGVWGEDGRILFDNAPAEVQREGQAFVYRVAPGTGAPPERFSRRITSTIESHMIQQTLPDGMGYLVSIYGDRHLIDVLSPDGLKWTELIDNASGGLYVPTGHLLFWRNGNLMAAPMSLSKLTLAGPPVVVLEGVADSGWEGPDMTVSRDGNLAYVRRSALVADRRLVWVDHEGHETALPIPPGLLEPLDITRDGKKVLYTRFDPIKRLWSLWSYSLSKFDAQEIPARSSNRIDACWSPDGTQVVFSSDRPGGKPTNMFRANADGGGDQEQITQVDAGGNMPQSWSRDGKWLVYQDGMRPDTKSDIWVMSLTGEHSRRPIVRTPDYDRNPAISPDGHWLAYVSETAGYPDVFVVPFPQGGTPAKISPGSGPLWDPNSKKLYLRRGRQMIATDLEFPSSRHVEVLAGTAKVLFEGKYMSPELWNRLQLISPDGLRFLLVTEEVDPNEGRQIQVVVNWFAELQRVFRPVRAGE